MLCPRIGGALIRAFDKASIATAAAEAAAAAENDDADAKAAVAAALQKAEAVLHTHSVGVGGGGGKTRAAAVAAAPGGFSEAVGPSSAGTKEGSAARSKLSSKVDSMVSGGGRAARWRLLRGRAVVFVVRVGGFQP